MRLPPVCVAGAGFWSSLTLSSEATAFLVTVDSRSLLSDNSNCPSLYLWYLAWSGNCVTMELTLTCHRDILSLTSSVAISLFYILNNIEEFLVAKQHDASPSAIKFNPFLEKKSIYSD